MNYTKLVKLTEDFEKIKNPTQLQKDIYNLKVLRYSIDPKSINGKCGCIGALDRAIKALKQVNKSNPENNKKKIVSDIVDSMIGENINE